MNKTRYYVLKRQRKIGESFINEIFNTKKQWTTATAEPMRFESHADVIIYHAATLKNVSGCFAEGPRGGRYWLNTGKKSEVV